MEPSYDFDLVCIGSGPAGQRAAIQAAKLGKRVAVIERRRILGGVCVETGTIPSKTFREAVLSFLGAADHLEQHLGNHFEGRPTAAQLLTRVAEVTKREVEVVADQLRRNDVVLIQGEASFKDAHTVTVISDHESRSVTAANILIAVGTIPALPDGVPIDGEALLTSDDMVNLKKLPRRMVVIGGGIIGIEFASMLAALKINVTLIDKRTRLLEFVDSEIVEELMHQMRNRNVTFRLGEAVERLELTEDQPRRAVITLESGKRIVSESVLYSVGRVGATDRLNLAATGLTADKRGRLTVDAQFRTEIPHIFAAGDVIGYPSLASTSASQGTSSRLSRLRSRGRAAPRASPSGDLCDPGNFHGRTTGARADRAARPLRNRRRPISRDRQGTNSRRRHRHGQTALSSGGPTSPGRPCDRDRRDRTHSYRAGRA